MARLILLFLFLLVADNVLAQPAPAVWVEEDGFVVIETESVNQALDPEEWVLADEPEGYTGQGYLRWEGEGNMYKDPLVHDALSYPDEVLRYLVWVNNPGEYAVHIRNIHELADGDNDVWFSINGSHFDKVWDHDVKEFTWTEYDKWTWPLHEGVNEIALAGRSAGFGIDRIVLHKVDLPEQTWGGADIPESPRLEPPVSDDVRAPSAPDNLRITRRRDNAIAVEWDPAPASEEVAYYEVMLGEHSAGTAYVNDFVVDALRDRLGLPVQVRAVDAAGNHSGLSRSVMITSSEVEEGAAAVAKYIEEPPVLDGEIEEMWHNQVRYTLTQGDAQHLEKEDLTAAYRAAWDENNLYVLFSITDDELVNEGEEELGATHRDDSVELYIDGDNSKCADCYDDVNDAQLRDAALFRAVLVPVAVHDGEPAPDTAVLLHRAQRIEGRFGRLVLGQIFVDVAGVRHAADRVLRGFRVHAAIAAPGLGHVGHAGGDFALHADPADQGLRHRKPHYVIRRFRLVHTCVHRFDS